MGMFDTTGKGTTDGSRKKSTLKKLERINNLGELL